MKASSKIIFVINLWILSLTVQAFALPMAGYQVTMERDWSVPYTMTDLKDNQVYQTFCLESHNYFTPGTTYDVISVGDYAYGGGGAASDGRDLVGQDTKWLYAAFMSGIFSSVDNAAQTVQNAIWHLEGETGGDSGAWSTLSQYKNSFSDSGWNVVAVNISLNGADNQSQLVGSIAPVPEPTTILFGGIGLCGIAIARFRKKKK